MDGIVIKRLDADLLGGAHELEKLCFSSPWSESALSILCGESGVGFAAVESESGRVLAYGGMLTVLDEGQITNIATHPDARRRGLGRAVVGALLEYGIENGVNMFSLEVRESNVGAIALYESFEFECVGVRKNFYSAPCENGIVMTKIMGDTAK